jgi:hypothetical protein
MFSTASPDHVVAAKTLAKVPLIQFIKDRTQIEMPPFMAQI